MHNANDCIFCKIVDKEIPADIVKETGNFIVIKDINPVSPIHLLIISKRHYNSLLDVKGEGEIYGNEIFGLCGELAVEFNAVDRGFRVVINTKEDGGQTVDHMHIHFMSGRRFTWPPG
ncbi:MAG TPA: HIT domain-containing protein [bacterium]|nr:HIT domain-containing protein [bacterium]